MKSFGSFSLISKRELGQESLPSKSLLWVRFISLHMVLAYFLADVASFGGSDVCRKQPTRNCNLKNHLNAFKELFNAFERPFQDLFKSLEKANGRPVKDLSLKKP